MNLEDSGGSLGLGGETVYGTHEDSHVVMSEKVQSLAGSIYQEFERMIARYDEDVVKTLMPLLVNVLECLDAAYQQNQEQDVELELLREDNEQLVTQYEREKGARKTAEQKLLEYEDAAEGERKELAARLEALESIVRMLELKHKNSMDHAGRLEEREAELKKEYAKLHERYTELFKTHVDYMERTKLLHSGQQLANDRAEAGRLNSNRINMGRSSGPISFGFASLENAETVDSVPSSPISSTHSSPSELDNSPKEGVIKVERGQATDSLNLANKSMVTSPVSPQAPTTNNNSRLNTKKEERSGNTLYQELSYHDDGDEDASDITGGWVHPGEYASSVNDNFYGMGKEVENLIMENNELLATKNALNVVKDDLIVKVDELTGEIDMLRDEILSLNVSRTKLKERVSELEEELRKLKEANEAKQEADDESDVPMAQRKRFTRVEMARVLMERNQYKERFMELQEAVRWTEMLRASRGDTPFEKHSNKSIWRFFSNLFSSNDRVQRPLVVPHLRYQSATNQVAPGIKALPRLGHDLIETEMGSDKLAMRKALERREQYRQVRAHVKKEDGRLQAYGWSLPGKVNTGPTGKQSSGGVPVPVPVYCRPLAETTPAMRIWCAAGVNLMGGYTKDGGLMVGGSVFYSDEPKIPSPKHTQSEVESLDKELNNGKEGALLETRLSSLVWICTTTHSASIVTVIDANNPAELLNSFGVCSNHILCIASVPGASPSDYFETVTKVECNNEVNVSKDCPSENVAAKNTPPSSLKLNEEGVTQSSETGGTDPLSIIASSKQSVRNHLGKVTFVEKDESAVNKKDKYAKAEQENCDSSKEALNETCETCDTTLDSIKSEEAQPETGDSSETKEKQSPTQKKQESQPQETQSQEIMSSVLATMWMGDEYGNIYVHSSVANWAQCLHTVKMKDAVIAIVHINGRVVVALACGQVAVFKRNSEGEWDLSQYHLVQLGLPYQSVRQLAVVGDKVWCGYRNKIHVLQPHDLQVIHTLEAHPRRKSPVRQMAWLGEGVWVSIRLDSTLRLYHAHTYQHLQDVDIEPYVSKMLGTGKLGFSLVRITSLLISSNRLWIGTSNGVIISVPIPGSYVPYCTMAHAQLSFHGHRDNVKFFVAVPGNGGMSAASTPSEAMSASVSSVGGQLKQPSAMLVISGGEGYVDFRIEDDNEPRDGASHLLVWQLLTDIPGNPVGLIEMDAEMDTDKKTRRSSILKPQKPRNPLSILDISKANPDNTLGRATRRVSFASSNFVKPFAVDPEKNTIWDTTYEEAVDHTDSTKSSCDQTYGTKASNFLNTTSFCSSTTELPQNDKSPVSFVSFTTERVSSDIGKVQTVNEVVNSGESLVLLARKLRSKSAERCDTTSIIKTGTKFPLPNENEKENIKLQENMSITSSFHKVRNISCSTTKLAENNMEMTSVTDKENVNPLINDLSLVIPKRNICGTNVTKYFSEEEMDYTKSVKSSEKTVYFDKYENNLDFTELDVTKENWATDKNVYTKEYASSMEFTCIATEDNKENHNKIEIDRFTSNNASDDNNNVNNSQFQKHQETIRFDDFGEEMEFTNTLPIQKNIIKAISNKDLKETVCFEKSECTMELTTTLVGNINNSTRSQIDDKEITTALSPDIKNKPTAIERDKTKFDSQMELTSSVNINANKLKECDMSLTQNLCTAVLSSKVPLLIINNNSDITNRKSQINSDKIKNVNSNTVNASSTSNMTFSDSLVCCNLSESHKNMSSNSILNVNGNPDSRTNFTTFNNTCTNNLSLKNKSLSAENAQQSIRAGSAMNYQGTGNDGSTANVSKDINDIKRHIINSVDGDVIKKRRIQQPLNHDEARDIENICTESSVSKPIPPKEKSIKSSKTDNITDPNALLTFESSSTKVQNSNLQTSSLSNTNILYSEPMILKTFVPIPELSAHLRKGTSIYQDADSLVNVNEKTHSKDVKRHVLDMPSEKLDTDFIKMSNGSLKSSKSCFLEDITPLALVPEEFDQSDAEHDSSNRSNSGTKTTEQEDSIKNSSSDFGNYTLRSQEVLTNVEKHLLVYEPVTPHIELNLLSKLVKEFKENCCLVKEFCNSRVHLETKHKQDLEETLSSINEAAVSTDEDLESPSTLGLIAPKTLCERIHEMAKRTKKYWEFVKMEDDYCYFYTLFGTMPFKVHIHPELGMVYSVKTYRNLSDLSKPICCYQLELFQQKLKQENLLSVLGTKFDIFALLDYIYMSMEEIINFHVEYRSLIEKYGNSHHFKINSDYSVTFEVLNLKQIIWWIITVNMSLTNLFSVSKEDITAVHKLGKLVNEEHIKTIAENTPKGINFLRNFIENVDKYVTRMGRKLKR